MPASHFGWSNRAQVFQVFGNKRKHEWTEAGDRELQMEASSKRQCPEPTECGDAMNEMLEINHNSILPTDAPEQDTALTECATLSQEQIHQLQQAQLQQIQEQQQQQYMQQQQQQHFQSLQMQQQHQAQQMQETFNPEIQQQQQPQPLDPQSNNTMVMDLCDETYSTPQLDRETQSMYSNMDSDFVPNLQQYGGGEWNPASGRIRCYCKQSWEGLMEMRPYVSDYY
ncbi:transcription factor SPT20 homolog isoform X1 [Haliotis rubra]|uniref:transcription factor SPT20 homolog isoform X1 n=1 Tax=Haliotis rubra TaxID=36100 RepID=UPI001EE5B16F|nr:transcription factor SPT20 homolog isoform X1 [Haliotis rubra]